MKNENTNKSTDTYVEFEYYWFDIQNGTIGERSKSTSTENYFYRESTQNVPTTVSEIPMRTEADTRTGGANYYCVQVLGKLVVNGVPQSGYYYKSLVPIISFGGHPINSNATTDKDYIFNVNVIPAQFAVSFDSQGGSTVPEENVQYDTLISQPAEPTKIGYTFVGWYKEAACQNIWDFATEKMPANAVTLYAKWEANTYSIDFNTNGGAGTMASQTFVYDTAQALEANRFTKEGYTFKGWSTTANGQVVYIDGATVNNLTATNYGTVTLYAVWESNQYSVTFKDWDGSVLKTEQVAYNTGATAPTEPSREGYRFIGWSAAFDKVKGDMEVTALYEKEEAIVPPTETEQPQTPTQGGEMNNTDIKTQTGTNLETAKTGDDVIVETLMATGSISSIAAAIAFFFRKKKKSES